MVVCSSPRGFASFFCRQTACALGLVGLAFALSAAAQPGGGARALNLGAARAVIRKMDADARLRGVLESCPADTFRREATRGRLARGEPVSLRLCLADPDGCHDACVGGRSGEHCFNLARAFQESEEVIAPRYAQMLFSIACAAGSGAGCTNRAASIRNSLREGDPFQGVPEAARDACQFRSFRIACREDDAWGCAMLGQSYQLGEGVARSTGLARGAFRKSCRLSPRFEACTFARDGLRELRR
jgi:hypothetical protein